jgi:hypothetical protein
MQLRLTPPFILRTVAVLGNGVGPAVRSIVRAEKLSENKSATYVGTCTYRAPRHCMRARLAGFDLVCGVARHGIVTSNRAAASKCAMHGLALVHVEYT